MRPNTLRNISRNITNMETLLRNCIHCIIVTLVIMEQIYAASYVDTVYLSQKSQNIEDVPSSFHYPTAANPPMSYFQILAIHQDHGVDGYMYVGGRNTLTELHLSDLSLVNEMSVPPVTDPNTLFTCDELVREDSEYICHNYITFIQEVNATTSIMCGTNALYPRCITYQPGNDNSRKDWSAQGLTASGPDQSTSTYAILDGENLVVYAGAPTTVNTDFAFSRKVVGPDGVITNPVGTNPSLSEWIETSSSDPSFVGQPIEFNGKIYFFFREEAVEATNVEKVVYSRVAQVCVNDTGGTSGSLDGVWTTFLKARLSCATQGDFKMYFNNLHGIYRSKSNTNIIFGVFTTPEGGIDASALCAYDLAEIEQLFAKSAFKEQASSSSLWLNVAASNEPTPRPGTCSETQPSSNYDRLESIALMSSLVPNKANYDVSREWASTMESDNPLLLMVGYRTERLVVQERTQSGMDYDVFFFGTSKGQILKTYIKDGTPRMIGEVSLKLVNDTNEEAINSLWISDDGSKLYASTSMRVFSLPTDNCARFETCVECVSGMDPACSWVNEGEAGCKASQDGLRDMESGDTSACPVASATTTIQTLPATPASESTVDPGQPSPDQTTGAPNNATPRGQPQTGTPPPSNASMGPTFYPPSTTNTTTTTPSSTRGLTLLTTTPPPPPATVTTASAAYNSSMGAPCSCHLVCPKLELHMCYPWILSSVILVCLCNVPACITLFYCCKKRRKSYTPSPLRRNRESSQKVPLHSMERINSDNEDEVDETCPMTDSDNNSTTIVNEKLHSPHGKNNGQTPALRVPSTRTPVRGTTVSTSDA